MHSQQLKTPIVPVGLLVFFCLCATLFAEYAEAGGVHFDPESPAGKEYALPLQQARNEALGTGGGVGGGPGGSAGSAPAPLFGVGVGGSGAGGRSESGIEQRGGEGEIKSQEGQPRGAARDSNPSASDSAAVTTAADADYSSGQSLLLLAGILILGIALGLGVRYGIPATKLRQSH